MSDYYILSLKHSRLNGEAIWWGPDACGYFKDLDKAGRYSDGIVRGNAEYYNNGRTTRACPVEEINARARRIVFFNDVVPTSLVPVDQSL